MQGAGALDCILREAAVNLRKASPFPGFA